MAWAGIGAPMVYMPARMGLVAIASTMATESHRMGLAAGEVATGLGQPPMDWADTDTTTEPPPHLTAWGEPGTAMGLDAAQMA
jgi:hypothetical protein